MELRFNKKDIRLPIVTQSLLIRPFALPDAADVLALSREPSAQAWLPSQVFRDQPHAAAVLASLIEQYAAPGHPRHGPYVLAIEHRLAQRLIGHVGFSPLGPDVEIGFAIGQAHQGRGLAAEAVVAASRWAMRAFALDQILGIAAAANQASRRTLARAQFAYCGDQPRRFQGAEQIVSVYRLAAG